MLSVTLPISLGVSLSEGVPDISSSVTSTLFFTTTVTVAGVLTGVA